MRLVIHQALKDVRLLRWLLLAWVLVLVAFHGITLYVLSLAQPDQQLLRSLETVQTILSFAGTAAFIVIAVFLVQSDSPVTTTDFWLTRPISGGTMLASKLLTGVVILWVLPLLGDVIDLAVAGVDIRALGMSRMAFQLAWLLPLMAIAACTVGLPQFVLVAIIELLLAGLLGNAAYSLAYPWSLPRRSAGGLDLVFIPNLVACTLIALSIPLFAYPYLTRRTTRAAVLLGIAPLIFATVVGLVLYAAADTEATTDVALRSISISVDPEAVHLASRGDGTTFDVPLTVTGVPDGARLGLFFDKAWLRAGNGRIDLGELTTPRPLDPKAEGTPEVAATLRPALAGATLLPAPWNSIFQSRRRMTLIARSRDLASVGTTAAVLHLEVRAWLTNYRPVAAVPVRAGARFSVESRSGKVLDVQVDRGRTTVSLREVDTYETLRFENFYLLRNMSRKEAIVLTPVAHRYALSGTNWQFVSLLSVLPVSGTLLTRWNLFRVNVPSSWLDTAQLVAIERRPTAGDTTKTIEFPLVVNRQ